MKQAIANAERTAAGSRTTSPERFSWTIRRERLTPSQVALPAGCAEPCGAPVRPVPQGKAA
ncbi:MAG: hypothetical protein HZA63_02245 [Rhodocyclales bacterium]|nr:hypothetical protein [Rhodocyclales bacterium]